MTADDLRTRAKQAAKAELGPFPCMSNDEADSYEDGFVDGTLWHAAQQPSREGIRDLPHRDELALAILDASAPFRGPGGQTVPYVMPVHYAMADAVLALLNGAGS